MTALSTTSSIGNRTLPSRTRTSTPAGTLRLRAVPAESRHIRWSDDVVDNEGLERKRSKLCCIFHKAREAGESSSEDDSDSDSSSSDSRGDTGGGSADNDRARTARNSKGKDGEHEHAHSHEGCGDCGGELSAKGKARVVNKRRNAYEKASKTRETKK